MAAVTAAAASMISKNISCPHLMTLADLSPQQIMNIVILAKRLKTHYSDVLPPRHVWPKTAPFWRQSGRWEMKNPEVLSVQRPTRPQSLRGMTISLLFSKRSTRTRVAAESSCALLGGHALFLGRDDIQLGVNESLRDTAIVLSGMTQGIFARVGDHSEVEEMAKYASVPVINALSSLWHPTQVLADLQTLTEVPDYNVPVVPTTSEGANVSANASVINDTPADSPSPNSDAVEKTVKRRMRKLTIAYVGDSANVLNDMLVTYPRLGHSLRVASPEQYRAPEAVMQRVHELKCDKGIYWTADPREAVHGADVVVTDTWISMGQEAEYEERVKAFRGYQVTEQLCKEGGAKPDWKFLHCLPRKSHEVDDEVFYGPRSLVWGEAENRKWTIMALFHMMFGRRTLNDSFKRRRNVNTRQIMENISERNTKAESEGWIL